ncbi:hypothetical protein [Brucella anthropi]|uniref:hypothetical protein n=1 Tax=Brucella anthropi TaxID=529 RepID=UPI000E02DD37|nr:hypothetical protein [Brucella anthropi]SUB56214.1 Uncharacterised protein [Brucella anthropi]
MMTRAASSSPVMRDRARANAAGINPVLGPKLDLVHGMLLSVQFWRERDYPIVVWLLSLPGVSLAILWRSVPDMSGFNAILGQ